MYYSEKWIRRNELICKMLFICMNKGIFPLKPIYNIGSYDLESVDGWYEACIMKISVCIRVYNL
jgi:hypothetical protein